MLLMGTRMKNEADDDVMMMMTRTTDEDCN